MSAAEKMAIVEVQDDQGRNGDLDVARELFAEAVSAVQEDPFVLKGLTGLQLTAEDLVNLARKF